MRHILAVLLTLVVLLLSATLAPALESQRFLVHREDGAFLVTEFHEGETSPTAFTPRNRDDVLWHRNQANIFDSTAIGNGSGVISGDFLGIDMHDLYGDGTPLWSSDSGDTEAVGAAKSADLFAAATVNSAISGFTLRAFNQGSSTPLWSQDIPDAYLPNLFVRISDDGSRVVLAMKMTGVTSRVNTYDGLTGALVSTYHVASPSTVPRNLEISDDGSLAALRASSYLHVIETETGTARWTVNVGASSSGLAFSGDGNWLAGGWGSLQVYQWNGSSYDQVWTHNGGGGSWYLGHCAFSSDGGAFIAGFYASSYNQLRVIWWDPSNSTPVWTYDSPVSSGVYQDLFSGIDMASSGDFAVTGSWGDADSLNPEIHVFWPGGADPIYTVDSPGSIFSVVCRDTEDGIVASGAGKNVHANEYGNGGDIYAIEVGFPSPGTPLLVTGPGPVETNPPLARVFPLAQEPEYLYEFDAYGASQFGVNVACGDVTGDGVDEILTGAGPGAVYGPHIRGWSVDGTPMSGLNFLAYGTNKYGVNVTLGNYDDDEYDEIITGAGPGAVFGPHVRGWDYDGTPGVTPTPGISYFAYGTPKWGVNVSSGDIDGDGYDEIITGAGPGAVYGPHVRGWNVDGGAAEAMAGVSFLAYGTNKYGVNVTSGDVDGDGIDEIITGAGPGQVFGAHIRGWNYDGATLEPIAQINFFVWPPDQARYGVNVFAGTDLNNDGIDDLIASCGPDPGMGSPVKVFLFDGSQVSEWITFEAYSDMGLTHGVNVTAGGF